MIAELLSDYPNAFDLIYNFNKTIGRTLSDDELKVGVEKFLQHGDPIGVLKDGVLIGFMNLYCNNTQSLEAYICNLHVIDECRGHGFARLIMDKAIDTCVDRGFETIKLHVAPNNVAAITLHTSYGFHFVPEEDQSQELLTMKKQLPKKAVVPT